jgi:hypothetical protein
VAHAVILATQEAEIRRITVRSQPGQIVQETLSGKTLSQKLGLLEWLKVKALSSRCRKDILIHISDRGLVSSIKNFSISCIPSNQRF